MSEATRYSVDKCERLKLAEIVDGDTWVCDCNLDYAERIAALPSLLAALRDVARPILLRYYQSPDRQEVLDSIDSALALVSPPNPRGTT